MSSLKTHLCLLLVLCTFFSEARADVVQSRRSGARPSETSVRTRSESTLPVEDTTVFYTPLEAWKDQTPTSPRADLADAEILQKDFHDFFRQVEHRFRNVIKKRHVYIQGDPHTIQGIPIIFNSLSTGFNLGVRLALYNIRREDPYKAGVHLQYWESDLGRKNHMLQVDFPHIFDSKWRMFAGVEVDSTITETYYGLGTMQDPNQPLNKPGQTGFAGLRYYDFKRDRVKFALRTQRQVGNTPIHMLGAVAYQTTDILPSDTVPQEIFTTRPLGVDGGHTPHYGLGLNFDTRDFEPYPTQGHFTELFVTDYPSWMDSRYQFTRLSVTDIHYIPLRPRVVFAHLFAFETILGDPPFFELGIIGGFYQRQVSGGQDALRGFNGDRFIGHTKWVHQLELRYEFGQANWWRQRFDFSFVPHIDIMRAWDKNQAFTFDQFAISGGWGVRARWNKNFILRADFGFSREGQILQVGFGNAF